MIYSTGLVLTAVAFIELEALTSLGSHGMNGPPLAFSRHSNIAVSLNKTKVALLASVN